MSKLTSLCPLRCINSELKCKFHHDILATRLVFFAVFFVCLFIAATGPATAGPPIVPGNTTYDPNRGGNGSTSPGFDKPWIGHITGANAATGNKVTTIPLMSWKTSGGMAMGVTLYHNAFGNLNSSLGACWSMSYQCSVNIDNSGNAIVHWDDGSVLTFAKTGSDFNGSIFSAPPGEHGNLKQFNSTGHYVYTSKNNIRYVFDPIDSSHLDEGSRLVQIIDINNSPYAVML